MNASEIAAIEAEIARLNASAPAPIFTPLSAEERAERTAASKSHRDSQPRVRRTAPIKTR